MRVAIAIFLLALTSCYRYVHVDHNSVKLQTDAAKARISAESTWPLTVLFLDTKNNLVDLRPIPKTAFIWNDTISLPLTAGGISFDGRSPYNPKDGKVSSIGFYMNPDKVSPPLKPGSYNISMQLNGVAGIHTVCGSFKIISEIKQINSNDLH